jgi:hypothetical protein
MNEGSGSRTVVTPCGRCGSALQIVPTMPGHLVCGSGHLTMSPFTPPAGASESQPPINPEA